MTNTIFVMLIASSSGTVSEAYNFQSMSACENAVKKLQVNAVCIEKKPVDIQAEMRKMVMLMKVMQNEFNRAD